MKALAYKENVTEKEIIVKSACQMCHGVCGTRVHIKDGKVLKVTGDKDCPTSRGYICAKGKASVEQLYHPDRLKYPLKRVGERGENKWRRISWEEAIDTIAEKLLNIRDTFGPQAICSKQGTGRPYMYFHQRFMAAIGSPNRVDAAICLVPRMTAAAMTLGEFPIADFYGFGGEYPKCVLLWGCNIPELGSSDGMCGSTVYRALKRPGTKSIVVDPRRTSSAALATHHLQLRPGTDGAVALAMLNVVINEELYDKKFVANWCIGFEELKERVRQYTPEWAEKVSWVPAQQLREAARTFAANTPAALQWGNGLDQNINSFQNSRAVITLVAICGNIDVPGGTVWWVPPVDVVPQEQRSVPGMPWPEIPPEIMEKKLSSGKYRITGTSHLRDFYDAVLTGKPYPVKALMILGCNLFLAQTFNERILEAFQKLDFIFTIEYFMTPSAQYSDIVLPSATWLECDDVHANHYGWCVLARQKLAQIGECKDARQMMLEIARKMGCEKYFPWKNMREYCEFIVKDTGMTFEQFCEKGIIASDRMAYRKYEMNGFKTPSGKVELRSSKVAALGYNPLPYYVEPPETMFSTPEKFKAYPIVMIASAKNQAYFNSEGKQLPSLRKLEPDPKLEVHSDTARKYGIAHGDWVWIDNPRGARIKMRAFVTDEILPGVIAGQHGWWFPEKGPPDYGFRESNVNLLTDGLPLDPHTGSASWRGFLVRISKAA